MSERASATTVLRIGKLEAPVALYKTEGKPPGVEPWETAGPNGGALVAPEGDAPAADPLSFSGASGGGSFSSSRVAGAAPLIEEGSGVAVPRAEVRKGIRLDGVLVDLTDQIARIDAETKLDAMTVAAFIRREQVPREQIIGGYWLVPQGDAVTLPARSLVLLRDAMRTCGRVAVVKWTARSRQSLGVIVPHRSGALLVLKLAFADSVRAPLPLPAAQVSGEEVARASKLIEAMSDSRAVLEEMEDDAVVDRRELVALAQAGMDVSDFLKPDEQAVQDKQLVALEALLSAES